MALIIAEAGTGHWGASKGERRGRAIELVNAAHEAGAHAVKFQMFVPLEPLFCPLNGDNLRMERWKDTAMPRSDWMAIKDYAESCGIIFACSVFQMGALELYKSLNPKVFKVGSRAAQNFPYTECEGPFFISTRPGPPIMKTHGSAVYFECEPTYPSTEFYQNIFPGFSDHSGNPWRAIDAIARGATHVEVHLDLGNAGPDTPAAISPEGLETICEFNREITAG